MSYPLKLLTLRTLIFKMLCDFNTTLVNELFNKMLVTMLRLLVDMRFFQALDFTLFTKENNSKNHKF